MVNVLVVRGISNVVEPSEDNYNRRQLKRFSNISADHPNTSKDFQTSPEHFQHFRICPRIIRRLASFIGRFANTFENFRRYSKDQQTIYVKGPKAKAIKLSVLLVFIICCKFHTNHVTTFPSSYHVHLHRLMQASE